MSNIYNKIQYVFFEKNLKLKDIYNRYLEDHENISLSGRIKSYLFFPEVNGKSVFPSSAAERIFEKIE